MGSGRQHMFRNSNMAVRDRQGWNGTDRMKAYVGFNQALQFKSLKTFFSYLLSVSWKLRAGRIPVENSRTEYCPCAFLCISLVHGYQRSLAQRRVRGYTAQWHRADTAADRRRAGLIGKIRSQVLWAVRSRSQRAKGSERMSERDN